MSNCEVPLSSSITRRGLLRNALLGSVLLAAGVPYQALRHTQEQQAAYDRDFTGFQPLTQWEFNEVLASHTEIPLAMSIERISTKEGDAQKITFELKEESSVYLYLSGSQYDPVFVQPLVVRPGDGGKPRLAPVIHASDAEKPLPFGAKLGTFPEGEHSFMITEGAGANLPSSYTVDIQLTRPSPESLLAKFIDHAPAVKLKNKHNPLDDMPLMMLGNLSRKGDMYKLVTAIVFSGENGGTKPFTLNQVFGRIVDIEWVMQQLFDRYGHSIKDRQRFQAKNHTTKRFFGDTIGNQPVLQTATPNNNFDDGVIQIFGQRFANPFTKEGEGIYYSPKPIFLPDDHWNNFFLTHFPVLQQWSLFEAAFENCVAMTDRNKPEVQAFVEDIERVKKNINGNFIDRGCDTLLPVPESYN